MCQEARDNVLDAISVTNQKNLIKDVSLDQLSKNKIFQFMANIFTTERNKKSGTFLTLKNMRVQISLVFLQFSSKLLKFFWVKAV